MARLFGHAHDPVTDTVLGSEYITTPPLKERIAAAINAVPYRPPAARYVTPGSRPLSRRRRPRRTAVRWPGST